MIWPGRTLTDLFRESVERDPRRAALIDAATTLTWAEYAAAADALADVLTQAGVTRGTRVCLLTRNSVAFHVADVAVLLTGATPFSIGPQDPPEAVLTTLDVAAPTLLLAEAGFEPLAGQLLEQSAVDSAILLGTSGEPVAVGAPPHRRPPIDVAEQDIALLWDPSRLPEARGHRGARSA